MLQSYTCMQYTVIHIIHIQMNLNRLKWAQWDKTQSRELLGLFICVCIALHCAQLLHTILHRTDLIIFPLTLQTITVAPMMSIWGKGVGNFRTSEVQWPWPWPWIGSRSHQYRHYMQDYQPARSCDCSLWNSRNIDISRSLNSRDSFLKPWFKCQIKLF